jgi:DOMON domain
MYKILKGANMKINSILIIIFLIIISPLSADSSNMNSQGFQNSETKGIVFQWKIIEDNIEIILSAPTEGWVAVGFNPSRMMKDANILIGYVKNGEIFMEDHFGSGNTKHQADTDLGGSDDITVISGSEEENKTILRFSIPLNSGDLNDQNLEKGKKYKVIFAYGKKDNFTSYHKLRTSLMITL